MTDRLHHRTPDHSKDEHFLRTHEIARTVLHPLNAEVWRGDTRIKPGEVVHLKVEHGNEILTAELRNAALLPFKDRVLCDNDSFWLNEAVPRFGQSTQTLRAEFAIAYHFDTERSKEPRGVEQHVCLMGIERAARLLKSRSTVTTKFSDFNYLEDEDLRLLHEKAKALVRDVPNISGSVRIFPAE